MGLEVIYGDTDSIMVNTNSTDIDEVFKLGNRVKSEVNKLYRLLEIDIDGVFKSMLLLKKKKYAALNMTKNPDGTYSTSQELKGLDIVRRDWCDLAKEAGNFVVKQILSGELRETVVENIHAKLQEVGEKVRNNELPLELFYITKQLTKNPEDYPDKKSQSHVQVALRFNTKGGKRIRAGDTVSYVICVDGSSLSATQRAYHPEEMAKNEALKLDTHYYLAQQIHPVVLRLCEPIEGTDAAHLAECLGLDPSGYRHSQQRYGDADEEDALLAALMTEEEKYQDCTRFKFICPMENCGKENIVDGAFTFVAPDQPSGRAQMCYTLAQCQKTNCPGRPYLHLTYLQNTLVQDIRAHIAKYYAGWLKCEDSACGARMRKLPLTFQRGHPICVVCKRGILHQEYSDSALYTQLCFYQYIFDVEKAKTLLTSSDRASADSQLLKDADMASKVPSVYRTLKTEVDHWQRTNAYSQVNLSSLFQGLFVLKQDK